MGSFLALLVLTVRKGGTMTSISSIVDALGGNLATHYAEIDQRSADLVARVANLNAQHKALADAIHADLDVIEGGINTIKAMGVPVTQVSGPAKPLPAPDQNGVMINS